MTTEISMIEETTKEDRIVTTSDLIDDAANITNADDLPISLAVYAWLNYLEGKDRKSLTIDAYRRNMNNFLKATAIYTVGQLNYHVVNRYLIGLKDKTNALRQQKISIRTRRLERATIMAFTKFLYKKHIIKEDFSVEFTEIKLSGSDTHARKSLTLKQAQKLIRYFNRKVKGNASEENIRNLLVCRLMLSCGLRASEVSKLNTDSMTDESGVDVLVIEGKARAAGDTENVILPPDEKALIERYLKVRKAASSEIAMFVSCKKFRGNRITPKTINWIIKRALLETGIVSDETESVNMVVNGELKKVNRHTDKNFHKLSSHSCRHFCACQQLRNGVDVATVSQNLRHKTLTPTTYYVHDVNRENDKSLHGVSASLNVDDD